MNDTVKKIVKDTASGKIFKIFYESVYKILRVKCKNWTLHVLEKT